MLMMLATVLATAPGAVTPVRPAAPVAPQQPAIQLTLNRSDGDYSPGDEVGVRVQTRDDGYILVLRVDDDRQIQVLFPLDPNDDAFVKGGKEYEVRGRGAGSAFEADDVAGSGLIYAAVSKQPLDFSHFVVNGHWDYGALRLNDTSSDPEHDLTLLVSQTTDQQRFDYDDVGYSVQQIAAATTDDEIGNGYYPGYYDPYYNPSWRCLGCGWAYPRAGFNINVGLGYGGFDPYYDPFLFDPWWYDGYYGYGGYYGGGYYGYPGLYPPVVVGGRPVRTRLDVAGFGTRARPRYTPQLAGGARGPVGRVGTPSPVAPTGRPDAGRPRPMAPQSQPQPRVSAPSSRPAAPRGIGTGVRARPRPNSFDVGHGAASPGGFMPGRSVQAGGVEARPVFREPPRVSNGSPAVRSEPQREARPVYREPPRVEQAPQARPSSPEVRPSARPAPPRAAPAPAPHGGGARAPAPRATGGHGRGR